MTDPALPEIAQDAAWQRLDPRMLLVHPVRELLRFLPAVIGVLVAGTASGHYGWQLVGVGVPVGLGLLRYVTTSFRITAGRVELRRGLLDRHVLSTPVDRVRTVDLTASPIHRVLGLATVRVGTGASNAEEQLDLDSLPVARARELRLELLRVAPVPSDAPDAPAPGAERPVLELDPAWVRFAPLTSSGLVITAGVVGVASQAMDTLGLWERLDARHLMVGAAGLPWWALAPVGVVGVAVLVSALSIGGYLVANWGFVLSHADGAWHLRRGLLTTRETSLDDERLAGVSVCEPLGLRLAGGGRVAAIVTGLDRRQQGSSVLVPPAPRPVVLDVAREVLGTPGPIDAPLVPHGPRARRRRFTRALVPAVAVLVAALLLVLLADAPGWLPVAAFAGLPVALLLAADRARALGHALTEGHLVASSGSLNRHRHALATEDVIGWTFRSSWFQRRAGLASLSATTAGGAQAVTLLDVPEQTAEELAATAVPGLVEQFLA
jgi:putative membrane protein